MIHIDGRFAGKMKSISRSPFIRQVITLSSGTAIAQALGLLVLPALSRLYEPTDIGLLALFGAINSALSVVATLRYQIAIVLPKEEKDAASLAVLATATALGTAVLLTVVVALSGDWIGRLFEKPSLASLLWWLPLSVLTTAGYGVLRFWFTRKAQFLRLSIARVISVVTMLGSQIAIGILGGGVVGLIGGQVLGSTVGNVVLGGRELLSSGRSVIRRAAVWSELKSVAKEYAQFPKYNTPQSLLNALSASAPVYLLAYFFDASVVGFYGLAYKLVAAPASLLAESVRQVFYQRATAVYNAGGDVFQLLMKTTLGLFVVAIAPVLVVVLFGPDLSVWILGKQWREAGEYAQWLMLWGGLLLINPPSVMILQVFRMQKLLFFFDLVLVVCRILTIVVSGVFFDSRTAIASFSVVGVLFNAALIATAFKVSCAEVVSDKSLPPTTGFLKRWSAIVVDEEEPCE